MGQSVWFRMVSTLISEFYGRRVTQSLVYDALYTNFSILRKTGDTEFVFRMVFTLISVF